MSDQEVGDRLARLRTQKGLSQRQLANLADVSENLIKSIEIGRRKLALDKANRFARILGVQNLSAFYGSEVDLALEAQPSHPAVPEVRIALTSWQVNVDGQPESVDYLRGRVDAAWQTWHTSAQQRSEAGRILPGLLEAAQRSARLAEPEQRRRILPLLAQAYHVSQAFLAWHGERELVYLTVDRGMAAALDADDPLSIAGSVWYAAHLLRAVGRADEALHQLAEARELVQRHWPQDAAPNDWPAMMADLWLCSALTKARAGDVSAWADLGHAETIVYNQLPEGYAHPWTRVGRTLYQVNGVMVAADLGDVDQLRRRAADIDPETIPSTERKARHLIEVARGTNMEGSPEGTLSLLTQASQVSPETLAYTPSSRELVGKLVKSSGATTRREAEALARIAGIDV